jgi:hypothetical protein
MVVLLRGHHAWSAFATIRTHGGMPNVPVCFAGLLCQNAPLKREAEALLNPPAGPHDLP